MSTAPLSYSEREAIIAVLKEHWGWLLALGVAFVVLGTLGVLAAVLLTIVSVILFGVLLLVAAVLQLIHAYRVSRWRGRVPHILIAIVYGAAGLIMMFDPIDASAALTVILALLLVFVGVMRLVLAYQMRKVSGWGWALAAGLASLLLAGVIFAGWPQTALWVIGLIVAVELIVNGWMCIFVALAARRA